MKNIKSIIALSLILSIIFSYIFFINYDNAEEIENSKANYLNGKLQGKFNGYISAQVYEPA